MRTCDPASLPGGGGGNLTMVNELHSTDRDPVCICERFILNACMRVDFLIYIFARAESAYSLDFQLQRDVY